MTSDRFPDRYADTDVCYLTTTGRRTGRPHRIEIWFGVAEGIMYLISGNGPGADWFMNLRADPEVRIEVADEMRLATARVVTDAVERRLVGEIMREKHGDWGGDPLIGLTIEAWRFEVPAAAIEDWRAAA